MKNKEQGSLEVKSLIRDFRWSNVKGKQSDITNVLRSIFLSFRPTFGSSVQAPSFRGSRCERGLTKASSKPPNRSAIMRSVVRGEKKGIVLKGSGLGALPRIPRPKELSGDLVWIRPRDRFELLYATCEA